MANDFALYAAAATATTHAAPNSLSTSDPYGSSWSGVENAVSSAWVSQGAKLLLPKAPATSRPRRYGQQALNSVVSDEVSSLSLVIDPSGGDSINWTLKVWFWVEPIGKWVEPVSNSTLSGIGEKQVTLDIGTMVCPIFIQVSAIDSGSLAIYHDGSLAEAL